MNCPYCNYSNEKDSKFCENCGAPLPVRKSGSHTVLIILITAVILISIGGITAILLFNDPEPKKKENEVIAETTVHAQAEADTETDSDTKAASAAVPTAETPMQPESEDIPTASVIAEAPSSEPASEPVAITLSDSIPSGLASCAVAPASNASASSTIVQSGYDNSALCLIDGKEETSWQEGVSGNGIGEYADIQYSSSSSIKYLVFKLGNWRDDDYFYGNNRPKTLTLTFDGKDSYTAIFPSEKSVYYLEFSSPVTASHLRITIDDVYDGTSWDDTCIAEITAYAQN